MAELRFLFSAFDPYLNFIYCATVGAAGALTTHIDDVLGRGEPGVPPIVQKYLVHRFGAREMQDRTFTHVGMRVSLGKDFSVTANRRKITAELQPT